MLKKTALSVLVSSLLISGCASMNNEDTGTIAGGVIGGLLGSQFGGGTGRVLAAGAGTLIGAYLGGNIGRSMDKQDQIQMRQALETAKTGRAVNWTNPDSGNRYSVTPTKTYYSKSKPCRDFRTVAYIGGKKEVIHGKACRDDKGRWQVS